jgi:hypothetical protein
LSYNEIKETEDFGKQNAKKNILSRQKVTGWMKFHKGFHRGQKIWLPTEKIWVSQEGSYPAKSVIISFTNVLIIQ